MSWVKLDDKFHRNEKILAMSDAAHRIYVDALSYCGDVPDPTGYLSDKEAAAFVKSRGKSTQVIAELVELNAFERVPGGLLIHDFEKYLPKKSTDRVRAFRERKRNASETPMKRLHPETKEGTETVSETQRNAPRARRVPVPDPVPDPGNASKKATPRVREALTDAILNGHADDLALQLAKRVVDDVLKRDLSPLEVALCEQFVAEYAYLGVDDVVERMQSQLAWGIENKLDPPNSLSWFTQALRIENSHRADAGQPKAWRPPPVAGDLSRLSS